MNPTANFETLDNPPNYRFEWVPCYACGATSCEVVLVGEEDLTGKEGNFQYVRCCACGLCYQNPRVHIDQIHEFYDSEYIAHRKKKNWGILTPLYERAMSKHDREKVKLVSRYIQMNSERRVLDVGCAVGTFLLHLKDKYGCAISGVDFKEGLDFPRFEEVDFHQGLFYGQERLRDDGFDLITMWHFLEHCYDPPRSLRMAHKLLRDGGRLIIEVPRLDSRTSKWFGPKWPGVQAPQHTVLFDRAHFEQMVAAADLEIVDYLPYGAFPSYFYVFAGSYFRLFGKGMNLDRIIAPYFLGQALLTPMLLFERQLNLAMQTIICRKKP